MSYVIQMSNTIKTIYKIAHKIKVHRCFKTTLLYSNMHKLTCKV